ncbi:hypothetical protein JB92DRAFT_2828142 [Gautieria morchelliformis]|nr:hypothetical protein JB92DRAFT_2828142 [Gautieria morchelliformis]
MKFSSATIAVFAASTAVWAGPVHFARDGGYNATPPSCPIQNGQTAGAAYFITNDPDGNFIVGSDIGPDGKLTFKDAIWAGGRGAHGLPAPFGTDPFFSQGAIKVSGNNVFTVNYAQAGSNTATMFSIDPNEPAKLKMVGQPVSTGGEFPVSVTISKQSGQVCVLNGGRVNGVNCFKQDPKLGLIQLDNTQRSLNLNQTTPATGPPGTVSHVIFSENGSQLLASVKGVPPVPGFVALWDVDPKTGALSPNFTASTPTGGLLPFSMTIIPGKDAILATDAGIGFEIFDFQNSSSATSSVVPIAGQKATCWSSFSSKTGNYYLTDVGTATLTEVHVDDQLQGSIVKQYPQGNGTATIDSDIVTINNKDFLYIMAAGETSILALSLDAPGKATPVQTFNFAVDAKNSGVSIESINLQGMAVFVRK